METPSWARALERRFGDFCVPNLAAFLVAMNAAVWALSLIQPEFLRLLYLEPRLVFAGEVWRVFTFLFIPPVQSPIFMLFWLYLLYIYAGALEAEWGEFAFNLFYGIGAVAVAAASLATGVGFSNLTLNSTIFLAFAALYPDFELLLFFILPVKVKWLAWIAWAGIALQFLAGGWLAKLALATGVLNYVLFFGRGHIEQLKDVLERRRRRERYKDVFKDRDE